ncbi:ribonuclease PH [Sciscionella sediminilitoris]|uniref:ribonuclease PH n=1 Tax=Sciscionella sediminilitoris TaxID=1445613 RepID=UPI0004DF6D8E|nr:ribonuclease PH [Sciscionella sp. SE31]
MARTDGRNDDQLRDIKLTRGFQDWPAGSVLVEFGNTRVLCAASVTEGVPRWRTGSGLGWVTAEYAMLPSATHTRGDRESVKGKIGGRTHEISRLVGRSLRACIDLAALGENTIVIDCDVLQADGGTRTAAITGGYVALHDAVTWLRAAGALADPKPLSCAVSAISVGVVDGRVRLDLPYEEDSRAEVDMNVVATDAGTLVEVQGTGEGATFPRSTLDKMLDLATAGCDELCKIQAAALEAPYPGELPEPPAGKSGGKGKGK